MNQTLPIKLAKITELFDVKDVLGISSDIEGIQEYYRKNVKAYKYLHDKNGFVHMGLSQNGKYNKTDTFAQVELISNVIQNNNYTNVLELAGGIGSNSLYLAKKFPDRTFVVTDLPKGQFDVEKLQKFSPPNLTCEYSDFHNLSKFEENSFELVFVIEALCHSTTKELVFEEVKKVLKPGGMFIVIDGYSAFEEDSLSDEFIFAKKLIEKGMAVSNFETLDAVKEYAKQASFSTVFEQDATRQILPSTKRHEKLARRTLFKHKKLGSFLTRTLNDRFVFTAISGYLMSDLIELGVFKYYINFFKSDKS